MLALRVLATSLALVLFLDPLEVTHQKPLNNVLLLKVSNAIVKQVPGGEVFRIGPKLASSIEHCNNILF